MKFEGREEVYYAKSNNSQHEAIILKEHLERVSALAQIFGEEIGMTHATQIVGKCHDFGKYSESFQGVLQGTVHRIDHAFASAAMLYCCFRENPQYEPLIESVLGHHDGLNAVAPLAGAFLQTFRDKDADVCPSGKTSSLRGKEEFERAMKAFQADFPDFKFCQVEQIERFSLNPVGNMLGTRMLFSCLVDADYSVSASDDNPDYLAQNSRPPLDAEEMLSRLEAHCAQLRKESTANPALNLIRNQVYEECGKAGTHPKGLFTLTAPTGVGKTLAMLHFALQHCKVHSMRRIIVALPFLTLAEQTEKEYRKIFPEVLVDHSQSNLPDELRDFATRWDAPVIITTSVRLFESLFSNNPGDCRKLHNLANSVILFDESQSLPAELAGVTVKAVQSLCNRFHCTIVFSTATQPDFGAIPGSLWNPTEIISGHTELFSRMNRVHVQWRRRMSLSDVAQEMMTHKNACCIVNLRRHAKALFQILSEQVEEKEGLFLLSTDLCPAHRLEVVEEIKRRQRAGLPCIVVATQCIEAGVDLDFDVMYRALAPLEAMIQAAGRCNRNGRLKDGGLVVIFEPQEEGRLYPDDSYQQAASIVKNLWVHCDEPDFSDLQIVEEYYRRFFSQSTQNPKLEKALAMKSYPEVAKEYRLIRETGVRLIVPWLKARELFNQIWSAVKEEKVSPKLLHHAAPITISCFDEEAVRSCSTPIVVRCGKVCRETGYYILNPGFESLYDPVKGFDADNMINNDTYML